MKKFGFTKQQKKISSCIFLSAVTGVSVGAVISLFKYAANKIYALSKDMYTLAAAKPQYTFMLFGVIIVLSMMSYAILKWCPSAKGGGIPSSIGIIRGILKFKWLKTLIATISASFVSYLAGLPLGTEGPSVQVGTAMAKGITETLGKKYKSFDRYIMTGGAGAGFAVATSSPIAGVVFTLEETHKKFSPMIVIMSFASVLCASYTSRVMCHLMGMSPHFIEMKQPVAMGIMDLWIAAVVGIVCGLCAVFVSALYKFVDKYWREKLSGMHMYIKLLIIFIVTAIIGLCLNGFIGSGHGVIEELFENSIVMPVIILLFIAKSVMILSSSNTGATGGMFIPMLTLGALAGALVAQVLVYANVSNTYIVPIIVIGMASFIAASMHMPMTALTFTIEALFGLNNILFVSTAIFIAYLIAEFVDAESITDMVLATRIRDELSGKKIENVRAKLTAKEGSFAIGKEIRDLFLPYGCVILSITKDGKKEYINAGTKIRGEGYEIELSFEAEEDEMDDINLRLCDIFGKQEIKYNTNVAQTL